MRKAEKGREKMLGHLGQWDISMQNAECRMQKGREKMLGHLGQWDRDQRFTFLRALCSNKVLKFQIA